MTSRKLNTPAKWCPKRIRQAKSSTTASCGMSSWYWHIEGYEGTKKIFERDSPYSHFSESQIKAALMALTAKSGLTFIEIINAYAAKKAPMKNELLHVHRSFGPPPTYT